MGFAESIHSNVCLVIIFNHRFDKNIEKLQEIYKNRFKNIFFVMPFYDGDVENVIPVYCGSDTFQGFIAQAFYRIKGDYSHYVFIADDMLLNDSINENTILNYLNLTEKDGYIKSVSHLSDINVSEWGHAITAIMHFCDVCYLKNFEHSFDFLPPREEAVKLFARHGIVHKELDKSNVNLSDMRKIIGESLKRVILRGGANCSSYMCKGIIKQIYTKGKYVLPYPLAMGYSDFIIIPQKNMRQFAHICGVFATMRVFVEVAIPTAMLLCLDSIVYENEMCGVEMWHAHEVKDLQAKHDLKIESLYNEIRDRNLLYFHPIKLSQWS